MGWIWWLVEKVAPGLAARMLGWFALSGVRPALWVGGIGLVAVLAVYGVQELRVTTAQAQRDAAVASASTALTERDRWQDTARRQGEQIAALQDSARERSQAAARAATRVLRQAEQVRRQAQTGQGPEAMNQWLRSLELFAQDSLSF